MKLLKIIKEIVKEQLSNPAVVVSIIDQGKDYSKYSFTELQNALEYAVNKGLSKETIEKVRKAKHDKQT